MSSVYKLKISVNLKYFPNIVNDFDLMALKCEPLVFYFAGFKPQMSESRI